MKLKLSASLVKNLATYAGTRFFITVFTKANVLFPVFSRGFECHQFTKLLKFYRRENRKNLEQTPCSLACGLPIFQKTHGLFVMLTCSVTAIHQTTWQRNPKQTARMLTWGPTGKLTADSNYLPLVVVLMATAALTNN